MTADENAPPRPLLVTADPDLLDDLLRLTASAGGEAEVAGFARAARPSWQTAPVVIVGPDLAGSVAELGLPRRRDVALVGHGAGGEDPRLWRAAVELGADSVVLLPAGEHQLVEQLARADRADEHGAVVAVVGGCGGAGASVLAAGLVVAAVRGGLTTLLVDADPWGGGADLLLGGELVSGLRWADLAGLSGTVSGRVLADALPRPHGVGVVSWDRGRHVELSASAVLSVLDAAVRSHSLVVVDLPRRSDEVASAVLSRALTTLLVVPAEVRAAAAASQTLARLRPGPGARLVVRTGRGRALEPALLAATLDLPLVAVIPDEARVAAGIEAGDPPGSPPRCRLARVCDGLVTMVRGSAGSAAA